MPDIFGKDARVFSEAGDLKKSTAIFDTVTVSGANVVILTRNAKGYPTILSDGVYEYEIIYDS